MADKINNNNPGFWNINNLQITADSLQKVEVPKTEKVPVKEFSEVNSKTLQQNADAAFLRAKLSAKLVQKSPVQPEDSPDLQAKADKLKEIFENYNKTTYEKIAPHIEGLSRADSQKLKALYQQQTGRNLLSDLANHLFMEDTIRVFEKIAPERIHSQIMPQPVGSSSGEGIEMDPPTDSVMWNSEVKYTFKTKGIGGDQKISYLLQSESGQYLEEKGDRFTTIYPEPADVGGEKSKYYRVAFQVRYGNRLNFILTDSLSKNRRT